MPIAAPTDYTDLDYASLRKRLLALAASAFPDVAWDTDAGLETLLLELNAYVGDVLLKYLNNAGRETRWGTAQQRRNLLSLGKLIGYEPPGAEAATAQETFTLSTAAAAPVTFPAGTIVKTAEVTNPVKFQLLSTLTIAVGQTSATALVEHSANQIDRLASTGLANQRYTLAQTPFLDRSSQVAAADGVYAEVVNFLSSKSTDRHFTITVDDLDRATITFGNGVNGTIPSGTITVTYKTGGGVEGNVSAGKLNRIEGSFTDQNGTPVRVLVSNAAAATGGVERASATQIRDLAPQSLRVLGRAVAREDFEVVARGVPGVARAIHLTRNEDPSVGENAGIVFIVPEGGGALSASLQSLVLSQFKQVSGYPAPPYPMLNTFQLAVQTAAYLTLDVSAKIWIRKGYSTSLVAADVRARLTDFFAESVRAARLWDLAPDVAKRLGYQQTDTSLVSNPLVDFGYAIQDVDGEPVGSFAYSDVYDIVRDTAGVLKVSADNDGFLLGGQRADVAIGNYQFPVLGTVTLYNAADGTAL